LSSTASFAREKNDANCLFCKGRAADAAGET
jgi:hypothetical protein